MTVGLSFKGRAVQRLSRLGNAPVRYRVWDNLVRTTHWLTALAATVLVATGLYIGNPMALDFLGQGFPWMGTARLVHFYAGLVLSLAVVSRVVWLVIGPPTARWPEFFPTNHRRWADLRRTLLFYFFALRQPPKAVGHNPLAGLTYLVVFGLFVFMIATGLGLYAQQAHLESPMRHFEALVTLFGGAPLTRWLHHGTMWLLVAFTVLHLYCVLLVSRLGHDDTGWSMVTGYKRVSQVEVDEAEKRWGSRG
jgi:Ni/Fe-hydrogenase 1 B-type cytochrome subunit